MAAKTVDARTALLQVLLTKIANDRNPSVTMMDMAEELLTPDEMGAYVEILLSKIRADNYPSIPMMNRVRSLAGY
jgi:hypothetical protein